MKLVTKSVFFRICLKRLTKIDTDLNM